MHDTPTVYSGSRKVPLSVDVAIGVGSAVVASGLVTPIILTIDKAVV